MFHSPPAAVSYRVILGSSKGGRFTFLTCPFQVCCTSYEESNSQCPSTTILGNPGAACRYDAIFSGKSLLQEPERKSPWVSLKQTFARKYRIVPTSSPLCLEDGVLHDVKTVENNEYSGTSTDGHLSTTATFLPRRTNGLSTTAS